MSNLSVCLYLFSVRFDGYFSRLTWVSRYQNVSILDFIGAKNDGDGGDNCSYMTAYIYITL